MWLWGEPSAPRYLTTNTIRIHFQTKKKKPFLTSTALKKNPNTHTHTHNCLNLILILDLHLFKQKPYVVDIKGR